MPRGAKVDYQTPAVFHQPANLLENLRGIEKMLEGIQRKHSVNGSEECFHIPHLPLPMQENALVCNSAGLRLLPSSRDKSFGYVKPAHPSCSEKDHIYSL